MNIAFIPIDNRPVCYTLAKQIADIDNCINLFVPDREWLGDLTKYAETEKLFDWLKKLPELDAIILPLDTLAYGGLISSRRCPDTFEQVRERIYQLREILEEKRAKIYAFSSIMRISNNNVNEEEKEYWNKWGKKIFDYSFQTHKLGCESCATHVDISDDNGFNSTEFGGSITNVVPSEILNDYLGTRKRNFEINKIYLEWEKDNLFETLVFSKDDCAEYGFNVQEAKFLEAMGGFVKTGADEIPLTLLARAVNPPHPSCGHLLPHRVEGIKVAPIFLEPDHKNLISNYEDVSIENSVKGQLELAGCEVCEPREADILLYVNNFEDKQGEIVMKVPAASYNNDWETPQKPYMIADVRFANGADNAFVEKLLDKGIDDNFYGYSAWNTSANSLGSLICAAKVKFLAKSYNDKAFKKLQAVRFLDDWAYQANVRQELACPEAKEVKEKMKEYEMRVYEFLDFHGDINYKFPWNRLFEIEVDIK